MAYGCPKSPARKAGEKRRRRRAKENGWRPRTDWIARLWSGLAGTIAEGRARVGDLRAKWAAQEGRCALTGILIPAGTQPQLDHILPRSLGGTHAIDNLRFIHPKANYAKHAGTDAEFWEWFDAVAALRKEPS